MSMSREKNYVTPLHLSTKRDYLERMTNRKVECMKVARKYDFDFWDGERRFGYGGYKYIPGRWESFAKKLIKDYSLSNSSSVIDLGCGKGYVLHEIKKLLPRIEILGLDISEYAIVNSKHEVKEYLSVFDLRNKLPFDTKQFDLAISLATFHNLRINELEIPISEMERVAANGYLMVEGYRDEEELYNLECWALTAESLLHKDEWLWLFDKFKYSGDYEFIYF